MKPGAVLVDVAIDQGGCFETSRPTTHRDPTFEVDGITHYCVANMPGAVPITSTYALTNATLPYAIALADHGVAGAIETRPRACGSGVNVAGGKVTHPAVAEARGHGVRAGRGGARAGTNRKPTRTETSTDRRELNEHLRGSQPSHRRDGQGVPGDLATTSSAPRSAGPTRPPGPGRAPPPSPSAPRWCARSASCTPSAARSWPRSSSARWASRSSRRSARSTSPATSTASTPTTPRT